MFKLNNVFCAILLSLLLTSGEVYASAGRIVYSHGENYALNKDGQKRKLSKSAEIFAGDTLVTGTSGRMHLRFSDGGMVSVYPRSEYKIDAYDYVEGDDNRQQGFFSLLKGGARQITGLLGKFKREQFKFRTSVATIGIRGTGFYVQLCQADCYDADGNLLADGMYVKNDTGIISMSNDAGEIILAQGQSAHSPDSNHAPEQICEPPAPYNLASNDIEMFGFNIGDVLVDADTSGNIVAPPPPPPPIVIKANYMDAVFIDACDGPCPNLNTANTTNAGESITQNASDITAYNGVVNNSTTPVVFDSAGGVLAESGVDQTLGVTWSRWTGAYTVDESSLSKATMGDIHLIGATQLTSALPTGGQLSYQSVAGTSPTLLFGFVGSETQYVGTAQSIAFNIDYVKASITGLVLDATFAGGSVTGAQLNPSDAISGVSSVVNVTATCVTLCGTSASPMSGQLSINLVGNNAEGAFGAYALSNGIDAAMTGSYLAAGK